MESGTALSPDQEWPKVIAFGDSLTQYGFNADSGWLSMIASQLVRKCDVINRGFSGYNARYCQQMAPRIFTRTSLSSTAAFVVFLGANDASRAWSTQHVPAEEYTERLVSIVNHVKEQGVSSDKIILMSPPPVCDWKWIKHCQDKGNPSNRFEEDTKTYVDACRQAAHSTDTELVDLHTALLAHKNWEDFLSDGLHFSSEGAAQVYRALWPSVKKRTASLPVLAPLWADIDPNQPQTALLK